MSWCYKPKSGHKVTGIDKQIKNKGYKICAARDNPGRGRMFSDTYTEKQKALIAGELTIEQVRANDIKNAMPKAQQFGDAEAYEYLKKMYKAKTDPPDAECHMTYEEAKKKLQEMTPWKIDWHDAE